MVIILHSIPTYSQFGAIIRRNVGGVVVAVIIRILLYRRTKGRIMDSLTIFSPWLVECCVFVFGVMKLYNARTSLTMFPLCLRVPRYDFDILWILRYIWRFLVPRRHLFSYFECWLVKCQSRSCVGTDPSKFRRIENAHPRSRDI